VSPAPDERREFTRVPIPRDQSATFLRAGIQQFTVHLMDATPQGFAVTCPERLTVSKGDILQLRTSEGWIEARVARLEPFEEHHDYDEEFDCFLGLERLRCLGYSPDGAFVTVYNPRILAIALGSALILLVALAWLVPRTSLWPTVQSFLHSIPRLTR